MADVLYDALVQPFTYGFMARALAVSVLVGIICPILGSYVVTRGLAFMGDALAHAVLPGIVIGLLLGISPFAAVVPTGIVVAVLIGYLARRTGVSEDTSIGILFAGLFALGLVMLSKSSNINVNLEDLLLGQALGVSQSDIYVTAGLTAAVVALLYGFHKELVLTSFDRLGAAVVGVPTAKLDYLLLVLLAVVIVIALQAVGIVLVMAMLITPAATAYLLVRSFVYMMAVGALLGSVSAVVGLYLSFHLNLPSGPAMTLVATALFVVAAAFKRRVV